MLSPQDTMEPLLRMGKLGLEKLTPSLEAVSDAMTPEQE